MRKSKQPEESVHNERRAMRRGLEEGKPVDVYRVEVWFKVPCLGGRHGWRRGPQQLVAAVGKIDAQCSWPIDRVDELKSDHGFEKRVYRMRHWRLYEPPRGPLRIKHELRRVPTHYVTIDGLTFLAGDLLETCSEVLRGDVAVRHGAMATILKRHAGLVSPGSSGGGYAARAKKRTMQRFIKAVERAVYGKEKK